MIVNPASRSGATGRRWRRVEARLRGALGGLEVETTQAARDAERIAREGVRAGIERLVVAGGDGTVNEVVSGLLGADLAGYVQIGLLPLGTGGDLARSVGVARDLDTALRGLVEGKPRRVDAGRVRWTDASGRACSAWFCNVASAGISALVDEITARTTRALGGTAAFGIGTVKALLRYRSQRVGVRVDGQTLFDGPLVLAAVANGTTFGGGMRIGPQARIDDGLLDIVAVPAMASLRLLAKLPKLYRGTHLSDRTVLSARGRVVELDAEPGAVPFELDGDARGALPCRIEVVPGALSLIAPA